MAILKLTEFQNTLGLSDRALIQFITSHHDEVSLDPINGILIDTDNVKVEELANAIASKKDEGYSERLQQEIESRLLQYFAALMNS